MKRQPLLAAGLVCNLSLTSVWKDNGQWSVGRHDEREDNYGREERLSLNSTGAVSS